MRASQTYLGVFCSQRKYRQVDRLAASRSLPLLRLSLCWLVQVSLAAAAKPASSLPPRWLSPKMESSRRLWNFTAPSRLRVPAEILKGGQMHDTGERLRHEMCVFCSC